jgi:quercetin dioxygenase-like cupin family protein
MDGRRTFLGLLAAMLPATLVAQRSTPAAAPAAAPRELARHTLSAPLDAYDVVLLELNPGPGVGREHRHTGPVLGYVLDGRVRFGVDHGAEQIVAAGKTFFEQAGMLHSTFGSADATGTAKVLAFMVVPKGTSGTVVA